MLSKLVIKYASSNNILNSISLRERERERERERREREREREEERRERGYRGLFSS